MNELKAPYTVDYCRSAAEAADTLALRAQGDDKRHYWEGVAAHWRERAEEAERHAIAE